MIEFLTITEEFCFTNNEANPACNIIPNSMKQKRREKILLKTSFMSFLLCAERPLFDANNKHLDGKCKFFVLKQSLFDPSDVNLSRLLLALERRVLDVGSIKVRQCQDN